MLESVENAMTEMLRVRATCATAGTDAANSGPRIISAPSSTACCAPCWAPCALPESSLISSWMLGFWNSASAISAAFFIDCAATPAFPDADNGRVRPTFTWPLTTPSGCCGGPAGPGAGLENELRLCSSPEQAPSKGAPRIRPTAVRRVAPEYRGFGGFFTGSLPGPLGSSLEFRGPTIVSLSLD